MAPFVYGSKSSQLAPLSNSRRNLLHTDQGLFFIILNFFSFSNILCGEERLTIHDLPKELNALPYSSALICSYPGKLRPFQPCIFKEWTCPTWRLVEAIEYYATDSAWHTVRYSSSMHLKIMDMVCSQLNAFEKHGYGMIVISLFYVCLYYIFHCLLTMENNCKFVCMAPHSI